MADKHPYFQSSGPIFHTINHLRNSLPNEITSDTLKKLAIASNNESRIINILKFIHIIDEEGKTTDRGENVFSQHNDKDFQSEFSKLISDAYKELFELYGDKSWKLGSDQLISFFRQNDRTSAQVGKYQAITFQALSSLAGNEVINITTETPKKSEKNSKKKKKPASVVPRKYDNNTNETISNDIGLTVRIEINLPADGDQETYDKIFKSIRENLING